MCLQVLFRIEHSFISSQKEPATTETSDKGRSERGQKSHTVENHLKRKTTSTKDKNFNGWSKKFHCIRTT